MTLSCVLSPADTVVLAIFAPAIGDPNKVHQPLAVAQFPRDRPEIGILRADNHGLGVVQDFVDVVDHQFGDMGNAVEDEIAVCAHQAGYAHVLVVDAKVKALSDKALDNLDHRALTQVVGARLEAKAENPDPPVSLLHDELDPFGYLYFVAWQDRGHDGQV